MRCKAWVGIVWLVLVAGTLGCNKDGSSPTGPSVPGAANPSTPVGIAFMRGTVFDTAFRPLEGARIEVLDGPGAGMFTTAGARGEFSLTGAFDEATRFRASREGHVSATRTLQPFCEGCNPPWWINFALDIRGPAVNIGGDYTLTFVASDTCTMLPEDMRSRTYTATIPAASPSLPANAYFRLGGATFFEDWDAIGIGISGDYVSFWLETVVERVAPNAFLAFSGEAAASVATPSASTFNFPYVGSIEYCVTDAENGRYEDCYQGRAVVRRCPRMHQLIVTRR